MFGKLIKGISSVARAASNIPVVGTVLRATPGVGTALAVAGAAGTAYNMFNPGGGGGSNLPALPMGSMPALPGTANAPSIVGDRSIFRNDPNIAAALQAWAISMHNLRTVYRAPVKGYVVVRDSNGDPYALPKHLARQYAGWKPSKKPPISVGDWNAVQRADRTIKKVHKVMTKMTRVGKAVSGGKINIRGKRKCK